MCAHRQPQACICCMHMHEHLFHGTTSWNLHRQYGCSASQRWLLCKTCIASRHSTAHAVLCHVGYTLARHSAATRTHAAVHVPAPPQQRRTDKSVQLCSTVRQQSCMHGMQTDTACVGVHHAVLLCSTQIGVSVRHLGLVYPSNGRHARSEGQPQRKRIIHWQPQWRICCGLRVGAHTSRSFCRTPLDAATGVGSCCTQAVPIAQPTTA
jgi:hypothetical protein